ncbi:MAG TPA: ABC transporter permease [Gaiellaceae bacterium]|nr:ABC transporter permease [Gaiellaceae bacterium]
MAETRVRPRPRQAEPQADAGSAKAEGREYVTVIRPASRWPKLDFPELWHYRELLAIFIWRDLKVRYKQTVIGAGWAIFQPVITAVVYTLVFGRFAKFPSGHLPYPLFAFAGVLAMQYFTSAMTVSSTSLVANVGLITKVYFPRLLVPLGAVLVPLVDFVLALVILVGMMAWYSTWPSASAVFAPLFIVLAFITAFGIGLVLSALNVRYRDVPHILPVFMQVLPFLSGVPFALDGVPLKWQWLLALNPMTSVIAGWRWTMLGGPKPVVGQVALGVGVALLLLIGGLAFFRSSEPRFADTI